MKIALVFSLGFDGGGATTYGIQLYKQINKKYDIDIFKNSTKINFMIKSKYSYMYQTENFDQSNVDNLGEKLKKYDIIICITTPTKGFGLQFTKKFYNSLAMCINSKKVLIQCTHSFRSIRTSYLWEQFADLFDHLVTFSKNSNYIKYKKDWIEKFIPLYNGIDLTNIQKFRKKQQLKQLTYIGRYVQIKDPLRIKKIFYNIKNKQIYCKIIGIKRTISALPIFYDDKKYTIKSKVVAKHDLLNQKHASRYYQTFIPSYEYLQCYGSFDRDIGLQICSNSMFACDFFNAPINACQSSMQYIQAQIIAIGCIPVFDYDWSRTCKLIVNGQQTQTVYGDVPYSGIFLKKDMSNIDQCLNLMEQIYNNPELQKKYKQTSYQIVKQHFNSEKIYNNLLNNIIKSA